MDEARAFAEKLRLSCFIWEDAVYELGTEWYWSRWATDLERQLWKSLGGP